MKKVLSFVLVLCMILGSFGMAFAATDVKGSDYEDALTTLVGLGVIDGYADGTVKPEKVVTRAEAATLIIKAMGLADYAVAKTTKFADMDQAAWAVPFVAYAESLGFVAGKTATTFAPNEPVTSDQMIAMLVQAVGYKADFLTGGFPGAFVNVAKGEGMLEGVKSGSEGYTRGEVAQLIYNTLEVKFVRYDVNGLMQRDADDDMMTRLVKGCDTDILVYDAEDAVIDMTEYQGAYLEVYVNEDGDIVAVKDTYSVFLTGDYDQSEGTFETEDKTYTVEKFGYDNKETDAEEVVTPSAFTNGKAAGYAADADGEDLVIAAKVSGKKIKEIYSVAKWTGDVTVQWTEAMAKKLADEETPKMNNVAFEMNDDEEIDTDSFVLLGVDSLDDIEEGHIVTYYTANSKIVKVEVGTEVVEGTVSKVASNGKATINGKAYEVALASNADASDVKANDEGKFFLTYGGKIAEAEAISTPDVYAMITLDMAAEDAQSYGADGTVKVKMLTADGKEAIYVVEEDYAETLTVADFTSGKAVTFELDKNGEIDEITTAALASMNDTDKMSAKGFLDGKAVADDVIVFEKELKNGSYKYSVVSVKDIPVDTDLLTTQFVYDADDEEIVVIVLDSAATKDDDAVYGVYAGHGTIWDAEEEEFVFVVDMLVDGAAKEFTADHDDASKIATEAGALLKLEFTGDKLTTAQSIGYDDYATVAAVKASSIKTATTGFRTVADDAEVYFWNADKDVEAYEAAELSDIAEGDWVLVYEVDDADDEDGIDFIVFWEAE